MAQSTEQKERLIALIRQGEASRLKLSEAHTELRRKLDVPARLKASVKSEPGKWLGGSLLAGFATSFFFRFGKKKTIPSTKIVKKERSFFLGLLTLAFTFSKPVVKIYATKLLKDYLTRRYVNGVADHREILRMPPH